MPGGIGPLELAIVLLIVLVVFGPKRLPSLGRQLGTGMREFKDSITGKDRDEDGAVEAPRAAEVRAVEASKPAPTAVSGEVRAQDQPVAPRER
jgi:sec-independent protein translocase protein TatA